MNTLAAFSKIKLFILDVDGVLTDGSLLLLDDGQMARRMNIKDGYALQLAIKKGYPILILSGGKSEAAKIRLERLGIRHIFFDVKDKTNRLKTFLQENNLNSEEALYMGDDIPDIKPMHEVGLACCPADAVNEVLQIAHYISPKNGGEGCVRDVIEKVLRLQGQWNEVGIEEIASQ